VKPGMILLVLCVLLSGPALGAEAKTEPAPGAARRGSDFKAVVTWKETLATITWTEPLGGGEKFSVLTEPYIGWLTDTQAVVGWEVIAESKLTAKPYASLSGSYDMERIKFRWAKLSKLKPDTAYRYKLVSGGYAGKGFSFRTMPAKGTGKLRFAVVGDTQRALSSHVEVNEALFGLIEKERVPLVLHVGDLVYGGAGYTINGRKSWYRVLAKMAGFRRSAFMALAPGNHDLHNGKYPWPSDYFGDIPAGKKNAAGNARPPYYYSFDVANVHFVALSTEVRKSYKGADLSDKRVHGAFTYNQQIKWLDEDLKNAKADWTVAFFHQPLHTVGGYSAGADVRKDFGALFDKYKVPLIISGHDHSYQRTRRIVNGTRKLSETGTVQVISGGASNFFSGKTASWNVRYDKINHYLRVEVDGAALTVQAVNTKGEVFDRWRLKKTGQPEALPLPGKKTDAKK
jgi:3',5'-cyclic AMP phosphodiesterase CpdA